MFTFVDRRITLANCSNGETFLLPRAEIDPKLDIRALFFFGLFLYVRSLTLSSSSDLSKLLLAGFFRTKVLVSGVCSIIY
jgi:hypothetical protein